MAKSLQIQELLSIEGQEKQLAAEMFDRRLDVAIIADASLQSLRKLERLGLPIIPLGSLRVWRAANGGERPQPMAGWSEAEATGLWRGIDQLLSSELGTPFEREAGTWQYLLVGKEAVLRHDASHNELEVTRAGLDELSVARIRDILSELRGTGVGVLVPDHQVAVERALIDLGYALESQRRPVAVTPMLSHATIPAMQFPFTVTAEDVATFGEQSGDMNPLHFDEAFARKLGFEGRLAHGMIFNSWLTKLLGTEYPGSGTIFMRNSAVYLAPMYPGHEYTVRISTISADETRGIFRILAQLTNEQGALVTLAYNDVMKRPDVACA